MLTGRVYAFREILMEHFLSKNVIGYNVHILPKIDGCMSLSGSEILLGFISLDPKCLLPRAVTMLCLCCLATIFCS